MSDPTGDDGVEIVFEDERDVIKYSARDLDSVAAQVRRRGDEKNRALAAENARLRAELKKVADRLDVLFGQGASTNE